MLLGCQLQGVVKANRNFGETISIIRTVMMELVSETLVYLNQLMWVSAQED
jgi:hypothetical protein